MKNIILFILIFVSSNCFADHDFNVKKNCKDLHKTQMIISGYSPRLSNNALPRGGSIQDLIAYHFTAAGPFYTGDVERENQFLKAAHVQGICQIYSVSVSDDNNLIVANSAITDEQLATYIDNAIQKIQTAVSTPWMTDTIAAWAILPDELNPAVRRHRWILESLSQAIRKYDPENRPIMMYLPNQWPTATIQSLLPFIDLITQGSYHYITHTDFNRLRVKRNVLRAKKANKLAGVNKSIIPVLEMYEDSNENVDYIYPNEVVKYIPKFYRHDAYSAFANGASGFLIWSLYPRANNPHYTDQFHAWSAVTNELEHFELKPIFRFGKRLNRVKYRVVNGPKTQLFEGEKFEVISLSEINYNNNKYVLIVNSANKSVRINLSKTGVRVFHDIFTKKSYKSRWTGLGYEIKNIELNPMGVLMLKSCNPYQTSYYKNAKCYK